MTRLRALLDHLLLTGNSHKMLLAIAGWAPWIEVDRREEVLRRCMNAGREWTAGQLGVLFKVTLEERSALRLRTIRPAGFDDQAMKQLRRSSKAACERRRRQAVSDKARVGSKAAADDNALSDRDKTIYAQTVEEWRSTTEIATAIRSWPEFKPLDFGSVRKAVVRSCSNLIAEGWLESDLRTGKRRQPILFVRRKTLKFPTVHADFVSETPGQANGARL
ncbi:MAG: hypothetical protein K2W78_15150 [Xanthobacteraceae bacterium]|nr:hypothetical protein [Xanthobacteraceae bacterium]